MSTLRSPRLRTSEAAVLPEAVAVDVVLQSPTALGVVRRVFLTGPGNLIPHLSSSIPLLFIYCLSLCRSLPLWTASALGTGHVNRYRDVPLPAKYHSLSG